MESLIDMKIEKPLDKLKIYGIILSETNEKSNRSLTNTEKCVNIITH